MLEFRIAPAPFRFGLAEGIDPHQAPPGTLMTADNVVWKKNGQIGKRVGTEQLPSTVFSSFYGTFAGTRSRGRLGTRGNELLYMNGTELFSYTPDGAGWIGVDKASGVEPEVTTLVDTYGSAQASDMAIVKSGSNGILVQAWIAGDPIAGTPGELFIQVLDAVTGAVIVGPASQAANSGHVWTYVRVINVNDTHAIVIASRNAATLLEAWSIPLASPAISAASTLRSDVKANSPYFDACPIGANFVIVYEETGNATKLYSYDTSFAAVVSNVTVEAASYGPYAIDGVSGEQLYVAYGKGSPTDIKMAIHDPSTLAQTVAPFIVETLGLTDSYRRVALGRISSTTETIIYSRGEQFSTGNVTEVTISWKVSSAGVVTASSQRGSWHTSLISRPFMLGGLQYVVLGDAVWYPSAVSTTSGAATWIGANTYLMEIEVFDDGIPNASDTYTPHRLIGKIDHLVGGSHGITSGLPINVTSDGTSMCASVCFLAAATNNLSAFRQGVRLVKFATPSVTSDQWTSLALGQETYVLNGGLCTYDGRTLFDYGFARPPRWIGFSDTAGGNMVLGTYLYGIHCEYRSAAGMLYRGPVKTSATITIANQTVVHTISEFNLTTKQNFRTGFVGAGTVAGSALPLMIPLFRSTLTFTTNYFRLTYEPTYNVITPDIEKKSIAFSDTRADASIDGLGTTLASRPQIYTAGGVLPDEQPPMGRAIFYGQQRLWILANDKVTWWFSKSFQDDVGAAPGFSTSFRIVFDTEQTAGIQMDDSIVFFGPRTIAVMGGDGPARTGANNNFTTPKKIQTDVGCVNARSVVSMPDGTMFLSDRGIYLLTRQMEVVWIGRPIQDELALFPNVTSAVLVPSTNQVRFTCNNTANTAGIVLCYDYIEKLWSVSKYTDVDTDTYSCPIADAILWNGAWTFVTPGGSVYTEDDSTYLDAGSVWVPLKLETAWLSAAGPVSYQSVRRMYLHGESHTDHNLTISVGFDSDTSYDPDDVTLFEANDPEEEVTVVGPLECLITIGERRKCKTIRFKIEDSEPGAGATVGTGQGPSFEMFAIEVGQKKGLPALAESKRG